MKATLLLLIGSLCVSPASAEFRKWTRSDGKTAELELVSVSAAGDEKAGEFKMRGGRTITLKSSVFSEDDARLLDEWKPEAEESAAEPSVFDDLLERNLVKLKGKSLKSFKGLEKPAKYYVFYYTASWCGPCQRFTPDLVEFYEKNKNENFEIVLITSDSDEDSMEEYAVKKKMPWPQLKLKKAKDFKKKFAHGVKGIPSVIVCELDGKMLGDYRSRLPELENLVK